jgi:5S rRNA maturation endonuclease (ribonuclease M5)
MDIKQILESLGYILTDDNSAWRTTRLYSNGDNPTALRIYKNNGSFTDFVSNKNGSFEELIALTLGHKNIEETKNWLNNKKFVAPVIDIQYSKIKQHQTFSKDLLLNIQPIHDYVIKRGISEKTAQEFRSGTVGNVKGKLKNKYVWPIFNQKMDVIGFSGRSLDGDAKYKYIHFGQKNNWCWPCFLNINDIREKKEIILVESNMDILSMFEVGIRNVVCLFGCDLGLGLLNLMLKLDLKKIIIATNYDKAGQESADKLKKKLQKYWDWNVPKICLPPNIKDFNELLLQENGKQKILDWYKNL